MDLGRPTALKRRSLRGLPKVSGIGRQMHQDPHVPHVGPAGRGLRLQAGMAITIEPMINLGGAEVRLLDDGWTVVTRDGSLSAQFEHTVLVTAASAEVMTLGQAAV